MVESVASRRLRALPVASGVERDDPEVAGQSREHEIPDVRGRREPVVEQEAGRAACRLGERADGELHSPIAGDDGRRLLHARRMVDGTDRPCLEAAVLSL